MWNTAKKYKTSDVVTGEFLENAKFTKISNFTYKASIKYKDTNGVYGFIEMTNEGYFWKFNIETLDGKLENEVITIWDLSKCIDIMLDRKGFYLDYINN